MEIKKYIKALVVIMVVCFGIGSAILYFTGGFIVTSTSKETYNVNDEKIETMDGINNICVKGSSENFTIIPEDRKDMKVHLYGKFSGMNKSPKLVVNKSKGVLEIELKYDKNIVKISSSDLTLDISVPKNYKGDFEVDMTSGEFKMEKELNLNDLSIELSSGDVSLKNLKLNNLEIDMSSGELVGDTINTNNTSIELSSGEVELNNFTGDIKCETTSGDVSINYSKFDNDIDLELTSGNVNLDLPDDAQFYLDAEYTSGDIECDFPITMKGKYENDSIKGMVGNDKNKIKLRITSGDVNIK
ncbi:DUF4097 family beta strand repeat protein [Lutibacter sp. B2]|nr:DUF4097 family beta strand repeat protein [Lutibacter sp. B2]